MSEAHAAAEMPRYVSHKQVWALQISRVDVVETGAVRLSFSDAGYAPRDVKPEVVGRYVPKLGDYLVVYADGYESISPRAAFEEGYTRIGA